MPRESRLQRQVIALLRSKGAYVFKVVGSPMQQRGTPDLLVCYRGRFLGIETKMPGNKPTKLQELALKQIAEAGGTGLIAESVEDVERLLVL